MKEKKIPPLEERVEELEREVAKLKKQARQNFNDVPDAQAIPWVNDTPIKVHS